MAVVILLLLTIFCKLPVLWHPELPLYVADSQYVWKIVAGILSDFLGQNAFLVSTLALLNIFGQALMLNHIANRHHIFPQNTYLPAMTYILLSSLFVEWNYLSAALIANWFLLATYAAIFRLSAEGQVRKEIFNIGCFLSLSAMLVFPNIFLLLALFVALRLLRPFKPAEWVLGLLGLCTPIYFLAGILLLFDKLPVLHDLIAIGFELPGKLLHPEKVIAPLFVMLLLFVVGAFFLQGFMSRMLTVTKKQWTLIIVLLGLTLLAGTFTVAKGYNQWLAALVPVTWIIANLWVAETKKWIMQVLFYLLIGVVIFVQWFPNDALV